MKKHHTNKKIRVLVLNCSLTHGLNISRTEDLARLVLVRIKRFSRLVNTSKYRKSFDDDASSRTMLGFTYEWPVIARQIQEVDVLIFATPAPFAGKSSLAQGVIEHVRLLEEEKTRLIQKDIFNTVSTLQNGSVRARLSGIMEFFTFTDVVPPSQCCKHWEGERNSHPMARHQTIVRNRAVEKMAENISYNLVEFIRALDSPVLSQTSLSSVM
jgi:hypothetical protein